MRRPSLRGSVTKKAEAISAHNQGLLRAFHALAMTALLPVLFVSCAVIEHRDEIGVLKDLGEDQDAQKKILQKETRRFEKASEALAEGKITTGDTTQALLKKVGEPVLVMDEPEGVKKWSYKRGDKTWFNGEAIHFYFDSEGRLLRWQCAHWECPSPKSQGA